MITDTGIQNVSNQTSLYQVWVSTTDTNATSFKLFHEAVKDGGGWETYKFLPVEVKYVKLVLLEPRQNYRLFGELELYSPTETLGNPRNNRNTKERGKYSVEIDEKVIKTIGSGSFPNPFNPETKIVYDLSRPAQMTVLIFNIKGQVVRQLFSRDQAAGHYEIVWDGRDDSGQTLPSGHYWCRLQSNSGGQMHSQSIKMTILK